MLTKKRNKRKEKHFCCNLTVWHSRLLVFDFSCSDILIGVILKIIVVLGTLCAEKCSNAAIVVAKLL